MPVILPRATAIPDSARLRIIEAYIETLRAENEMLKRQLADAERRAARETAKAEGAVAEFSAITKRLTARTGLGDLPIKRTRAPFNLRDLKAKVEAMTEARTAPESAPA
jgi:hypothetical protein